LLRLGYFVQAPYRLLPLFIFSLVFG